LRGGDARPHFQKAVAADPDFAMAWLQMAFTSPTNKEFFAALDQAVAHEATASEGERLQIQAAHAGVKSDPEGQGKLLEKLVAQCPQDERALTAIGNYRFARQDWQGAVESLQRAAEIAPAFTQPYNQLGYAYRFQGKFDEAEKAFKKYTELLPDDPNPH